MADWAARAAVAAATSNPKTISLHGPLSNVAKALAAQVASVINDIEEDKTYFNHFLSKLDERFADRLAISQSQFPETV